MTRFTLQPRRWYACMFLGDEFDASAMCCTSPSPIRVDQVRPLATGSRIFDLSLFHANYPEGMRAKTYTLQTIDRGENGILARSTEHSPLRFLYLTEITADWLRHNFPSFDFKPESLQQDLERTFGGSPL